jgi:long-subunit fatty acid transport protein
MNKTATLFLIFFPAAALASTASGPAILETPNARPAAVGEAFSAATNDISALSYNPASLESLKSQHASFMYQKGISEDAYGQFQFGTPTKKGGIGLSLGYYNGGDITIFDGLNEKTVNAKTDLTVTMGIGHRLGSGSGGIAVKYISSQLIESNKATAYAFDAGLQVPLSSRVRLGAAVQNVGTALKYVEEANDLPQIARVGAAFSMFKNAYPTTLSLEAPYYVKDHELRGGAGLETVAGPLALRAGYRAGRGLAELTFGAGFMLGNVSVDYAYGLVQNFEASHRVSVGLRFGQKSESSNTTFSRQNQDTMTQIRLDHDIRRAMYE